MAVLEERVNQLEEMVMRLVYIQQKTEIEMQRLQKEMKEFKDEMLEFKEWAKKTIEENHEWSKREVRRINKQWGELANKMGTIVEDIVFPAVRPVIKKYFHCDPEVLMMNVERKKGELREEFDVIAVCKDKVFLIEAKSTLRAEHVVQMKEKMNRFKELFEEFKGKEIVPILASLRIAEDILNRLTKEKIYGMAYKEWEYMDILNFEEVYNQR
jgi:Holliday junction resolvase